MISSRNCDKFGSNTETLLWIIIRFYQTFDAMKDFCEPIKIHIPDCVVHYMKFLCFFVIVVPFRWVKKDRIHAYKRYVIKGMLVKVICYCRFRTVLLLAKTHRHFITPSIPLCTMSIWLFSV